MPIDRLTIIQKALERLGVEVWHSVRYANDTGTCLRCVSGTMVMVPDDASVPYFMQADGAEELKERVDPLFEQLMAEAVEAHAAGGARAALLSAAEDLYQEGYDAGYEAALASARGVFEAVILGKFGAMPQSLSTRIHEASFADMSRWAARIQHVRHVTALIT